MEFNNESSSTFKWFLCFFEFVGFLTPHMQVAPVVRRELRVCLRRPELRRWRNLAVYWATGTSALLLILEGFGIPILRHVGFWIFAFIALLAGTQPMAHCLGLIHDEREAHTFPLLYLAGISSLEFFAGKALSALWTCGFQFLGVLPLLALPFLTGGLSYQIFLGMIAYVPAALVASVGITLLASTLRRDELSARMLLSGLVFVWCLGAPLLHALGRMATGFAPFGPEVLWVSPLYSASLLNGTFMPALRHEFWRSIGLMWGVGLSSLAIAALWLSRTWRDDELGPARVVRPRARLREPSGELAQVTWNPVEDWVAGETSRLLWPRIGLAVATFFWLLGAVAWGRAWMGSLMDLLLMLFLVLFNASLPTFLLAAKVARDRKNGAMEELLSTRLEPQQIVEGHVLGIRRLVWPFQLASAGLAGGLWLAGLVTRSWTPLALWSYSILGAVLLAWLLSRGTGRLYQTFRLAFITGRATATLRRGASTIAMANIYNVFNLYRLIQTITNAGKLPEFPTGHPIEAMLVPLGGVIWLAVWYGLRETPTAARRLAAEEMRQLIQSPPPADGDPKFKKWDPNTPVPV